MTKFLCCTVLAGQLLTEIDGDAEFAGEFVYCKTYCLVFFPSVQHYHNKTVTPSFTAC